MKKFLFISFLFLSGCAYFLDSDIHQEYSTLHKRGINFKDLYNQERKITKIKTNGFYFWIDSNVVYKVDRPTYHLVGKLSCFGGFHFDIDTLKRDTTFRDNNEINSFTHSSDKILDTLMAYELNLYWVFDDGKFYKDNNCIYGNYDYKEPTIFINNSKKYYSKDSIIKIILDQLLISEDYPQYEEGKGLIEEFRDSVKFYYIWRDKIEPNELCEETYRIINDSTLNFIFYYSYANTSKSSILNFYKPKLIPTRSNIEIKGWTIFTRLFHKRVEFFP